MKTRAGKALTPLLAATLLAAGCGVSRTAAPLLSAPPRASADNEIYLADETGQIRAFRADGTEHWSYSLADDLARLGGGARGELRIASLAARSGGQLFGLATLENGPHAGQSILFALNGNHLLWHQLAPTPEQGVAPVGVGESAIYEAGDDGVLYAFARADGRRLWQRRVSRGTLGPPTVAADGTVYVTGARGNLHAVAPDGSERWVAQTNADQ